MAAPAAAAPASAAAALPAGAATAHVHLLELGPELSHEDVELLSFDDASQQLLVVKGGHVFAYGIGSGGSSGGGGGGAAAAAGAAHGALRWMYPLQVRCVVQCARARCVCVCLLGGGLLCCWWC
jgi:hypothetical protein